MVMKEGVMASLAVSTGRFVAAHSKVVPAQAVEAQPLVRNYLVSRSWRTFLESGTEGNVVIASTIVTSLSLCRPVF